MVTGVPPKRPPPRRQLNNQRAGAKQACRRRAPQDAYVLARDPRASIHDSHAASGALHAECDTLWSEDMHNGMVIQERLRIANPFRVG